MMQISTKHHSVPQLYLRQFAGTDRRVAIFRILVSDKNVPPWERKHPRSLERYSHLYSRSDSPEQQDAFERWLDAEFETPAAEPLRKATSGASLTPDELGRLVRFLASLDVRTPRSYFETVDRAQDYLPGIIEETLTGAIKAAEGGRLPAATPSGVDHLLPLRISTVIEAGADEGTIGVEVAAGRQYWLHSMKPLLTKTVDVLLKHDWTLLKAPSGLQWFTSDQPVVKLNYYGQEQYDFGGGWGRPGSTLFLPLNAEYLLITEVDRPLPPWGSVANRPLAKHLRRFIAENAHLTIFARRKDDDVPRLRQRVVDRERFREERERWNSWDEMQAEAERRIRG